MRKERPRLKLKLRLKPKLKMMYTQLIILKSFKNKIDDTYILIKNFSRN